MDIIELNKLSRAERKNILKRADSTYEDILPNVRTIMQSVKANGDAVLFRKNQKYFGKAFGSSLLVTKKEIRQAYKEVGAGTIQALRQMIKNITAVHDAQLPKKKDTVTKPEKGITVWRDWRAIERVGIYIPGGKAIYPSSVLMTAIPAQIAGCSEIIMCTPPRDTGTIPAATLVAADMIGLTQIYKIGGAEAIATMTYGTKSIPAVYKIFGAGNSYVTAAKMLAQNTVSIDMPAGPSEVLILADETANPSYIAADLLADGEHGEDSACVLVTTSRRIARETIREIEKQLPSHSTEKRARTSLQKYGLIIFARTLAEAITFTNEYAPEHLEVMTKEPETVVNDIINAGSIFLGPYTTKATGDYATGANHVLPTGGMAKMYPPLGVDSFGKWMQVQKVTRTGLRTIRSTIETIATVEQLPAHKQSVVVRFQKSK